MSGDDDVVKIVVSVDDEHLGSIAMVAEWLRRAGMRIDGTMDDIGVFTGSIDNARFGALTAVEGVSYVERSRQIQIAPPDADIQ